MQHLHVILTYKLFLPLRYNVSTSIKKKLKSLDGLEEVDVSLEQRNATVFYEEGSMTAQQIQEAINELGYKAGEPVTKDKKQ